jgi:hypothetical protein
MFCRAFRMRLRPKLSACSCLRFVSHCSNARICLPGRCVAHQKRASGPMYEWLPIHFQLAVTPNDSRANMLIRQSSRRARPVTYCERYGPCTDNMR